MTTRILLVHPRPTRGGFTAVVEQARELVESGRFSVHVAVGSGTRTAELPQQVVVHSITDRLHSISGAIQLRKILGTVEPEILHLHGRQAGVVGRIVLKKRRNAVWIYTPHGTPWSGTSTLAQLATDISERVLLRRTDWVQCVSHSEQVEWARRTQSTSVIYFPNRVTLPEVNSVADEVPEISSSILVPGGYNRQKRLEVVIEAIHLARGHHRVVMCGAIDDRRYKSELEALARRLGVDDKIRFVGQLRDVPSLMAAAKLVILPSYSEGMPIVGQEAVAVGANVLWSTIAQHYELFGSSGGSFWTAEELCEQLGKPPGVFTTEPRRAWLQRQVEAVQASRTDFWTSVSYQPVRKHRQSTLE